MKMENVLFLLDGKIWQNKLQSNKIVQQKREEKRIEKKREKKEKWQCVENEIRIQFVPTNKL